MSVVANPSTCFNNIIVLDANCAGDLPTSGLYGSRAGITRSYISQIITKDFRNEEHFFNEKLSLAIDTACNDIHSTLQPKYKATSVINNFRAGVFYENKVEVDAYAGYKGILFNINDERAAFDFYASELSLFLNYTGAVTVNVFDLMQDKIIDTIVVNTVAGEITTVYPLEKFIQNRKKQQLYFAYDATGKPSYKTIIRNSGGCTDCQDFYVDNSYERIGSFKLPLASDAILSNLVAASDTGGMSIIHSLQCNHNEWMCSISNLLAYPILYKTASLIHEHALISSPNTRFNATEGQNADLIQKAMDFSELKYREWMDNKVHSINIPQDERCFNCKSVSKHKIVLP
jgi:hypothetical protein